MTRRRGLGLYSALSFVTGEGLSVSCLGWLGAVGEERSTAVIYDVRWGWGREEVDGRAGGGGGDGEGEGR
jgi:hypothetical protein